MNEDEPLAAVGWNDRFAALFSSAATVGCQPGRVLRHDRGAFLIATREGVLHLPARRSVDALTVGDWVVVEDGAISGVLTRSSLLRRKDPAGGEQLLAANVDVVAMVFGADRPLKAGRLYRTRTQIWDAGSTPLVVLTKTDLLDDVDPVLARVHDIDPLLDVEAVCSFTGNGLEALRKSIADRTLVLIGESGAGKSTLVNALVGADLASVSAVRTTDHRGRHTTTSRELHLLPGGGVLIDTPGLREVGLWAEESAVDATFPEIEELSESCQFRDCSHGPEPGCAVTEAVVAGHLNRERYEAWLSLRREAASAARRADDHARRAYERQFGRAVKDALRIKRIR
ncbi:MAG: ribosome small subunit-dependent GTPase A [Acidimicrobiales bacterium]